jgi:excisionase family DNA binding protein
MVAAAKFAQVPEPRRALLSVEEVAELLQVPVSWVYDRTRSRGVNRIPGFRLGKYWRFEEGEVLAWLERQRGESFPGCGADKSKGPESF